MIKTCGEFPNLTNAVAFFVFRRSFPNHGNRNKDIEIISTLDHSRDISLLSCSDIETRFMKFKLHLGSGAEVYA